MYIKPTGEQDRRNSFIADGPATAAQIQKIEAEKLAEKIADEKNVRPFI
jgi:hypothetical protein